MAPIAAAPQGPNIALKGSTVATAFIALLYHCVELYNIYAIRHCYIYSLIYMINPRVYYTVACYSPKYMKELIISVHVLNISFAQYPSRPHLNASRLP